MLQKQSFGYISKASKIHFSLVPFIITFTVELFTVDKIWRENICQPMGKYKQIKIYKEALFSH